MEKIVSGLGIFALFVVFQAALPAHACVVDAYEPDDSSGSASTITHNSNQTHSGFYRVNNLYLDE